VTSGEQAVSAFLEPEQIERFWSKVNKSPGLGPNGDCWHWTAGKKNLEGYGGFYLKQIDNTINCHKLSFLLAHNFGLEDIPNSVVVRHLCNNPICVNPAHLVLGTYKDNSQDMVAAGNARSGEGNCNAKLTELLVAEIRELWDTGKWSKGSLADKFGVTTSAIGNIVTNKTWKDPNYSPRKFAENGNHRWKYGQQVIDEVRELRDSGKSYGQISAITGVSKSQISNIIRGRQRKG
jgi:plasmid maintenance system antidote protein VapI